MNRKVFITAICGLQLFTAVLLLFSAAPMGVTAVRALAKVTSDNQYVLAGIYTFAAGLALYREYCRKPLHKWSVLWFTPQLFIVVMGAIGALICIARGMYADGVPRPVSFIARDQIIYPILAWLYFRSISRP